MSSVNLSYSLLNSTKFKLTNNSVPLDKLNQMNKREKKLIKNVCSFNFRIKFKNWLNMFLFPINMSIFLS